MAERRVRGLVGLQQAFDEVRFGEARTLNLRTSLPTGSEAATRLEKWLRQHQVMKAEDVLVITGRGNNSEGGVAVVREAAIRVFHELRRKNIISAFVEHTPGSFVVTLASMADMLNAANRRRETTPLPPPASPPTLASLDASTRDLLRVLAERSLDSLGMKERTPFLEDEMLRLFGSLAATVPPGADREQRLRQAIDSAMGEYD